MKAQEIRALSNDQVKDKLLELRKEQMGLRFQKATNQLEKTHRSSEVRRDIARLKTEMNQRTSGASVEAK